MLSADRAPGVCESLARQRQLAAAHRNWQRQRQRLPESGSSASGLLDEPPGAAIQSVLAAGERFGWPINASAFFCRRRAGPRAESREWPWNSPAGIGAAQQQPAIQFVVFLSCVASRATIVWAVLVTLVSQDQWQPHVQHGGAVQPRAVAIKAAQGARTRRASFSARGQQSALRRNGQRGCEQHNVIMRSGCPLQQALCPDQPAPRAAA